MDENNRNFILAIVLSMAILFSWQYFFVPAQPPQQPGTQTAEQQAQQQAQPGPQQPGAQSAAPAADGARPTPSAIQTAA
ncbi:MAG: membrane protein insertase YidC, partial [Methyloceanibacter sp.]